MKLLRALKFHLINHADYYRAGGVLTAALALVGLYLLTQPIDLRRHNSLLGHFSQLQSSESRLGEAVLQLNFNLANNYDLATALITQMRATARHLREGAASAELRDVPEFQQQLRLLEQRLAVKQDVLEQFKSRNAVLKNSLLYLPLARDELARELPSGSPVRTHLNAVVEYLLLNRVNGGLLERGDVSRLTSALLAASGVLPDSAQAKLDSLMRHVKLIDDYERRMPGLVRQLTGPPEHSALAASYARYYDHQQERAALYRSFLLLATLLLLSYTVRSFLRMREQTLQLQLAASVFASASEGITITDERGTILNVNAAFTRVTGYERADVIGKNPRLLRSGRQGPEFYQQMWQTLSQDGVWQGEIWNRRKNGEVYPEWLSITAATLRSSAGRPRTHYVATFSDISQRKKDEAEIYQLAFYDPLTALPNRRLLIDRMRQILNARNHGAGQAALLFIDIDNFKVLNDTKGNEIGDLLLSEIGRRLLSCAREGDTVARLSSDEFVVLLQGLRAEAEPEQAAAQVKSAAEKIRKLLAAPYRLREFDYTCTCSIGISLSNPSLAAEEMLQHANTAMSQAKAAGRDTLRFFDPAMQNALEARAALESDLRQAVSLQQFALYYQIQVDQHRRATGAEALVRWRHPTRGLVSPAEFIPLAEEIGLIMPLGLWILQTACAQIKAWEAHELTDQLVLAVNISARQLSADNFVSQIESVLHGSGIEPSRLKLEITESMLLTDVEKVISTMRQVKALGVGFSLDDFGTGYSSLQYLKRLPLDQVKIDQSFVHDVSRLRSDQAIVSTIVAMAQSLDLGVIAEGVETEDQHETLATRGCTHFQGYLFSKPVPIDAFEALLAA